MSAAEPTNERRGSGMARLLGHCEAVDRVTPADAPTPRARLESELDPELASRLVVALAAKSGRA
jgi:hypothetical protein